MTAQTKKLDTAATVSSRIHPNPSKDNEMNQHTHDIFAAQFATIDFDALAAGGLDLEINYSAEHFVSDLRSIGCPVQLGSDGLGYYIGCPDSLDWSATKLPMRVSHFVGITTEAVCDVLRAERASS